MRVRHVVLAVIGLAVAAIVAGKQWNMVLGKAAVEKLCAYDGGLRINETTYVPGYLFLVPSRPGADSDCLDCLSELGHHKFEYVDLYLPYDERTHQVPSSWVSDEVGYYRLSLSKLGDQRCDAFLKHLSLRHLGLGFAPDECVAVEHLPMRPAGYVFSTRFRQYVDENGVEIGVDEAFIVHEPTDRTIASLRNYIFTSSFWLPWDEASKGGHQDASCYLAGFNSPREFKQRVLRDMTKNISGSYQPVGL